MRNLGERDHRETQRLYMTNWRGRANTAIKEKKILLVE
jgi:hypothetical protein